MPLLAALSTLLMLLQGCTSQEVGQSLYQSLRQVQCVQKTGSHGECARPPDNTP
ncbi:MAG: hypothetical protein HQM02_13765 [Magnetococcales bacterium]|nr:hypothetical protein [Magnetococcales bacterium]